MSVASNRYANKAFAEHPTALWPLDDDAYFVSLLDNSESDLSNWTNTNCTINTSPTIPTDTSPFLGNSLYYEIIGDSTALSTSGGTIVLESGPVFTFDSLSESLQTLSINFYLYQDSVFCDSYEFGIKYFDTVLGTDKEILFTKNASEFSRWIRFNETIDVPQFDSESCEIILKINVSGGGSPGTYNFFMHGLSVGQWSEIFSSKSIGSIPQEIPLSTGLSGLYGVNADQYGPLSDNAYYLVENGKMLSKNEGVPMVFGSENCTEIVASDNGNPSLIFPGQGLLSESGKYKVYSLEFWMRIKPNTKNNRKIFGSVDNEYGDGIYVSEGFITLVLGNSFATHNISEWYRPMLVHFIYDNDGGKLLINGEQVISLNVEKESISLSSNEWLGFFSYNDIENFEIDCVSIYPYSVPVQVAKRRMVWGQGVSSQEVIDSSFKGSSAAISFSNAKYSANVVYPDKERWDAGYYNNLVATSNSLSVPEYSLPEIFLSGRDLSFWYESNKKVNDIEYPSGNHPKFITFRPGLNESETEWVRTGPNWTEKCYLKFSNANIANAPVSAIYGVFEIEDDLSEIRPLIHIVNSLTNKRFEINIQNSNISYSFDGIELYSADTTGQQHVIAGLHIPTINESFGYDLATFFSSYEFLQVYVGGSPDISTQSFNTFEGKIYKIAFADSTNFSEISTHFNENGFANYEDDSFFTGHYSTYALQPFYRYEKFFLDISISSYWEEYFPLSFFSKYSQDADGTQYYGFDFLQFNIGYPSFIEKIEQTYNGPVWGNYLSLSNSYSYPVQKSYSILDNENITNYSNYDDLNNNLITEISLDTSSSSVDIFATFQLIAEGANQPLDSFTYTKDLNLNRVVDASLENTNVDPYKAYKTKFRVIDDTIIYPPKNIKTEDLAIVFHFSIQQDGILSKPLKIREMEISSKSLNVYQPNPIGTKFGKDIYPFVKNGIYLNYKEKNPFSIYKKNNPYLYLTENSGIKIVNYASTEKEYSIAIPINESRQSNFYIGASQIFVKYDLEENIGTPFSIFEIQSISETIEFVVEEDTSTLRHKIFARNKSTKEEYSNVEFYQNGIPVQNPFLIKNQWSSIGMVFQDPINMSSYTGSINIFGGCRFNNISTYLSEGLNETASIIPNVWQNVLTDDGITNFDWQHWYNNGGSGPIRKWKEVYVFAEEQVYSLSASDIYSSYLGTNINVVDDNFGINIFNDDFVSYSDISWYTTVGKPA